MNQDDPKGNRPPKINEKSLTPWQKERLRYLREQGNDDDLSSLGLRTDQYIFDETHHFDQPVEEIIVEEEQVEMDDPAKEPKSFSKKLPKLQQQHAERLKRRIVTIVTMLSIPLIIMLYYISPLNHVSKITVLGNEKATKEAIIEASGFHVHDKLWAQFMDRAQAAKKIQKDVPRVKDVKVQVKRLNQLKLQVKEYQELALLAKDNQYYPILENGYVVQEAIPKPVSKLPILEDFKDKEQVFEVLEAYHELSQEIQERISQIKSTPTASNDQLLYVYMTDGNQVIVNISNLASQMKYYPQVAKDMKTKGLIDMEVGIFTYAEQTTETSASDAKEE